MIYEQHKFVLLFMDCYLYNVRPPQVSRKSRHYLEC